MRSLLLIFLAVLSFGTHAQKSGVKQFSPKPIPVRNCLTPQMEKKLHEKYPNLESKALFEEKLARAIQNKSARRTTAETIYRIPTIIHVIHNGEAVGTGGNISAAQVNSQFEVLNEDFRRMGAGYNDHVDGADILVEFFPVTSDPSGNRLSEPGINRVNGGQTFWEEGDIEKNLKPTTIWDPDRYFNLWVVTFGGDLDEVLGYAQFPSMSNLDGLYSDEGLASTDGVIIDHRFFGTSGTAVHPYNGGRTATHEIGHWLGLIHIWGDGDCSVDDYCKDTPNANGANYECTFNDSCTGDDVPDMIENYMDYSPDACMNIFTQDQKMRMRTVLEVSPRRRSLISSPCDDAAQVKLGKNTTTSPSWHSYTASSEGVLTISSIDQTETDTYLSIYKNCESEPVITRDNTYNLLQSEASVYVQQGEEIIIYWSDENEASLFDWTLTETATSTGGACALAETAALGANEVPDNELTMYWYEYTMSQNQSKLQIDVSGSYYLYNGNCDELKQIYVGSGEMTFPELTQGEKVFIAIESIEGIVKWNLTEVRLTAGEACSAAVTATDGTNQTPSTPYWYTYTLPMDGILTVTSTNQTSVNTYGQLFADCDGTLLMDNYDPFDASKTELTYRGIAGEKVFIYWDDQFSTASFDWELSMSTFEEGEDCTTAVSANTGINSTPASPYWFTYTMPQDGNIKISSADQEDVDTYLTVLDGCDGNILAEADDTDSSLGSESTLFGLLNGMEIKILWSDEYQTTGFDWTLEVFESLPGDNCSNPATASLGANALPSTDLEEFWYTFTVPTNNKRYTIESSSAEYVYFIDECENVASYAAGIGKAITVDLQQGQQVLILWELSGNGDFTWTLTESELSQGDQCSDPFTAVEGTNSPNYAPAWYQFTMPTAGDLIVSSANLTTEDTYLQIYDQCGGNLIAENDDISFDLDNFQSRVTIRDLAANDQLMIYWAPTWSSASFDWSITISEDPVGQICTDAAQATEGTNSVPDVNYELFWTTFTMPANDKILQVTASEEYYAYLLKDCNTGDVFQEGYSGFSVNDITQGQEVYIVWDLENGGGFDWELTLLDKSTGDYCDNALKATEGTNTSKRAPQWFSYIPPVRGDLKISSANTTTTDTDLYVLDGCEGSVLAENDDINSVSEIFQSEVTLENIMPDEEIIIHWDGTWSSAAFDWTLEFSPAPGTLCDHPETANSGNNTIPDWNNGEFWYTFTMPETRILEITSSGTDSVYLLASCDLSNPLVKEESGFNYDQLSQGDEVIIYWKTTGNTAIEWTLTLSEESTNNAPEMVNQSFEVNASEVSDGLMIGTVAATDADNDPLAFSIVNGNDSGIFDLNSNTGQLSVANAAAWTNTEAFLSISVDDGIGQAEADISISVVDDTASTITVVKKVKEFWVYPNPARDFLTIDLDDIYTGVITDLSGRTLIQFEEEQVDVHELKDGIYLIRLSFENGEMLTQKIVISRR